MEYYNPKDFPEKSPGVSLSFAWIIIEELNKWSEFGVLFFAGAHQGPCHVFFRKQLGSLLNKG